MVSKWVYQIKLKLGMAGERVEAHHWLQRAGSISDVENPLDA
jgi:hypothetical protein